MNRRTIAAISSAIALIAMMSPFVALTKVSAEPGSESSPPNIVILVADDLGYADVGFHGSDIRTPNLDRLAAEGVRLERFYVSPVCSPTRAGLLTGRWPIRFGLQHAVLPPWRDGGLPPAEVTIAEMLATAGYKHRACIGKWHLGHSHRKYLPRAQGFTHFYGHYNGAIDYFTHQREGETDWHRGDEPIDEEGYSTDLLGAEAVRFLHDVPRDDPYLLYVPFNAPHAPFQAKEEDLAKYPNRRARRRTYAAMVDSMDQAIGRILEAIRQRGDADNTLVLFLSDNGGTRLADNGNLRGHKATLFEGGIRSVAVVRWPDGRLSGGRMSKEPIGYIDLLPTLRGIVGLADNAEQPLDGINVLPALRGEAPLPERPWFNYFARTPPEWSVQNSEWKLIYRGMPGADGTFVANDEILLFPVEGQARETKNVAPDHPKVVLELLARLAEFNQLAGGRPLQKYGAGRKGFRAPKNWVIAE